MSVRRDDREHVRRGAKPKEPEARRAAREMGLDRTIKAYTEQPSTETLDDGWVGVVFEGDIVTIRGYKNGTLSEIVGVVV